MTTEKKETKEKKHYVDNKKLYAVMCEWKEMLLIDDTTPMPHLVGESIIKIAYNLARRYNFSGYTDIWKDGMIGDGIEHCVKYLKNFDHIKYNNPHVYITRICFSAFVQRIKKERRDQIKKYKFFTTFALDYENEEGEHRVDYEFYHQMNTRVNDFEAAIKAKKVQTSTPSPLEKFYG